MTKSEFCTQLRVRLQGLPEDERSERLTFYREMIDDRIDDGAPEEEAVAAVGDLDGIVDEIMKDKPLGGLVIEKVKPKRRLHAWEIVLLCLGAPLWIPLLCAGFAVLCALVTVFISVIVAFGAAVAACGAAGIGGIIFGVIQLIGGKIGAGLCFIGAALCSVALFLAFGVCTVALTKLMIRLIKSTIRKIKRRIAGKERK